MVLGGFFIRGGLAVGSLYIDDEMIFGSSLIEAVDIEKEARYPRIVISSGVMNEVRKQMSCYADHRTSPHNSEILLGEDGNYFIDYLSVGADERVRAENVALLEKHREIVSKNLKESEGRDGVYDKYLWVAEYHNYYCKRIKQAGFKIKIPRSRYKFGRLVE